MGTVYNYYQTKGDILIATVALEVEEVVELGVGIVADPPRGVGRALLALIDHYYDHSLKYLSKEMWRTAMALSIEAPDTPNGRRYSALDDNLRAQVIELIARLQERGEVRNEIAPGPLGDLVFNNLNMMFIEFVKDDPMALEALKGAVASQMRPLAAIIATEDA